MKTFAFILSLTAVMVLPVSIVKAEGGDLSDHPAQMAVTNPALGTDPRMAADLDAQPQIADDGTTDHLAKVFEVKGDVRVLKSGADEWTPAQKEMLLEAGDQILTGKDSFMDVVYDNHFLNVARIESETKAEFRSIEPTELHLEDGKIFSALDGLAPGHGYRISTPTAVAGVRGTTFDVMHNAQFHTDIVNVYPDNTPHMGEVFLEPAESKAMSLTEGQGFTEGKVVEISAEEIQSANQFREKLEENFGTDRQEGFDARGIIAPSEIPAGTLEEQPSAKEPAAENLNPNAELAPEPDMETRIDSMLDEALTPPDDFEAQIPGNSDSQEKSRMEKNQDSENGDKQSDADQNPAFKGTGEKNPSASSKPDVGAMMNFLATGGVTQAGTSDAADPNGKVDFGGMMNNLGFQPAVSERFGNQLQDMKSQGMDMTHFISSKDVNTAPVNMPGMTEMRAPTADLMKQMTPPVNLEQPKLLDQAMMQTLMQEVIFRPDTQITQEFIQDFVTINKLPPITSDTIFSFLEQLRNQGAGRIYDALKTTLISEALSDPGFIKNTPPDPIQILTTENPTYTLSVFKVVNGATLPTDDPLHSTSVAVVSYNIKENGNIVQTSTAACTSTSCTNSSNQQTQTVST